MTARRRAAIIGTGHRAQMYTKALAARAHYDVSLLSDTSPTRMAHHSALLTSLGSPEAATCAPAGFAEALRAHRIDEVVVTTVDATHHTYITTALEAGCRVVTEKPMTTDAAKCASILGTLDRTGGDLSVTFNYRYNPAHEKVWQLLHDGAIGEIRSVHFEWLLDVRHGADYFRRWHREKRHSGGLLVHKSGHHFDLVNWWLGASPSRVHAEGGLVFYGRDNGERTGLRRDYVRAHGSPEAATDPYAIDLTADPNLDSLYVRAEAAGDSDYVRDRNVFGDAIDIEDDLALLVRYDTGATMTYHLTAYSPWEGYRVMFNGTGGRLELEVEENTWQPPRTPSGAGAEHGGVVMANPGRTTILHRPLWEAPREVTYEKAAGSHGGGDLRMLKELFGPLGDGSDAGAAPAAGKGATARDGALALAVGVAGNESLATGRPVETAGLW
ncbi:Gfo/Idh/MocA family oxidoreductase [Streptomyces sp. SID8379]|uniref:Gfo/Idh/MocA family protein n=1 Tax=unclassified Streptomyces TaxID=2593676 RepID=UPI0003659A33|nr:MULTISPECIES: Gfo/Idh/MocA family oxidoreductase [unclassified Streptomyces]MYW65893.1 Gfo/Idh/MocA family oxidoreductase [Streptomyces sp. SID8379]